MLKANVAEVKAQLSEYLDRASRGERIVICRHNKPVAELRAVENVRTEPRPIGPLPGRPTFSISPSFFDPMPDDELDLWEGVGTTDPLSTAWAPRRADAGAARVAETKAVYTARRKRRPVRKKP